MANFTPRMPSEDEDFDAVTSPSRPRKPRTPRPPLPTATAPAPQSSPANPQPVAITQTEPVDQAPRPVFKSAPRSVPVSVSTDDPEPVEQDLDLEMLFETTPEVVYGQNAYQAESESNAETTLHEKAPGALEPEDQPKPFAKPESSAKSVPEHSPSSLAMTTSGPSRKTGRLVFEAALILLALGLGLWTWQLYTDRTALRNHVSSLEANPQLTIQKQTDELIRRIGLLVALPSGETPTIANVSDAKQAKQQSPFFNTAENGDKVLMYVKAGEAILYRPTTNKIILVAPLTFNGPATASTSKP
jgi:hypothetical protein